MRNQTHQIGLEASAALAALLAALSTAVPACCEDTASAAVDFEVDVGGARASSDAGGGEGEGEGNRPADDYTWLRICSTTMKSDAVPYSPPFPGPDIDAVELYDQDGRLLSYADGHGGYANVIDSVAKLDIPVVAACWPPATVGTCRSHRSDKPLGLPLRSPAPETIPTPRSVSATSSGNAISREGSDGI